MNRRRFLCITALSAASLTITDREDAAASDLQALARPDLLSLLEAEPVREIGSEYCRLVPTEKDWRALRAAILARRGPSIAARVRRDFDAGRTVLVNGWVLAATEARQCALFSLLV